MMKQKYVRLAFHHHNQIKRVAGKPPEIQGGNDYGSTAQFNSNEL